MNRKERRAPPKGEPPLGSAPDIASLFQSAVGYHRQGDFVRAEALYREVLKKSPDQADALNNMGLVARAQKRPEAALAFFQKAITAAPGQADAHSNRGAVLQEMGRLEEALAAYREAVALKPDYVEAIVNEANALRLLGRPDEARLSYERAIALRPTLAEAFGGLGNALRALGRPEDALAAFRRATALKPSYAEAHLNLGVVLAELERTDEAIHAYRGAIQISPGYAEAHTNLGNALRSCGKLADSVAAHERALALKPGLAEAYANLGAALKDLGRLEDARAAFLKYLELKPGNAEAYTGLGTVLREMGHLEDALAHHRRAVEVRPDYSEAYSNMGNLLREMGRLDEAFAAHERAVALAPDVAVPHSNMGATLHQMGRLDEALSAYERAIAIRPDHAKAHWNRSLVLLLKGRYPEGWREHEWRLKSRELAGQDRAFGEPQWDGSAPEGKTILLHAEQGFGDTIQFVRYARLVKERGARVLLECPPTLLRLLQANLDVDAVIAHGSPLPPFDAHCPLLSLPGLFRTDAANVPSPGGYLRPLDNVSSPIQRRPAIGLVWRGRPEHLNDRNRSIPLALLEPLLRQSRVPFVSLQVGTCAHELSEVPWGRDVEHVGERISDFADTAAAVAALDLVIAVDTSVAHLAGALAKPVWVMLPHVPDWRWLMDGETTPWYASMRLFRQERIGDWKGVIGRVAERLASFGA